MKGPFTQVWAGFRESKPGWYPKDSHSGTVTKRRLEGDVGDPDRKEARADG